MRTLLCCIIKQENLYLRNFVEYYKNIGFTNIVLYDNNDENGEYPQQVIGDYIEEGFVIYVDARGRHRYQLEAYTECYKERSKDYDWIAFFDADEFLSIQSGKQIEDLLSEEKYSGADVIYFYWMLYGDNGLIHYDGRPVYDRFLIPNKPDPNKNNYKIIVRCESRMKYTFTGFNHR